MGNCCIFRQEEEDTGIIVIIVTSYHHHHLHPMYEATWVFLAERLLAAHGGYGEAFRDAFVLFGYVREALVRRHIRSHR